MSKLSLDDARRIAINCASKYNTSLENKQFIIIYRDKETNEVRHIEVVFLARNYQHLTGINLIGENGKEVNHQSEYFYKKCLKKKLSKDEIALKEDGTTQLKLEALPAITKFSSITKIIGDSNGRQPYLYVEKIVGGVNFCLGLRLDESLGEYVPVSALQKNIKLLSDKPSQVLAILEREYGDASKYKKIRHVAKGIDLTKLVLPSNISEIISLIDYKI